MSDKNKDRLQAVLGLIEEKIGSISGKTILEVGSGDGTLSSLLTDKGARVTAVDLKPLPEEIQEKVEFLQIPFEYLNVYSPKKYYDIAVAINTLPFLSDKKFTLKKLLDIADIKFFNIWGINHAWARQRHVYSAEEIERIRTEMANEQEILFFEEREYETPTISKPDEMTHWHEYWFLIKKKSSV